MAKQGMLVLSDWREAYIDEKIMAFLKSEEEKEALKKIKKNAVIGIVGIRKVLLNVLNSLTGDKTRAFDTEEEAKEWLVK